MPELPPISACIDDGNQLRDVLPILFENSPILDSDLFPAVLSRLQSQSAPSVTAYSSLIDASLAAISTWDDALKAQFIAGHPRIGQVKGLSNASTKEQTSTAASPEVIARLAHLNACYERGYPALRYITFVNGRSRAEIKDEMEDKLGLEHSLSPDEPAVESISVVQVGSEQWKKERERAIVDIGKIAKSRVRSWGYE